MSHVVPTGCSILLAGLLLVGCGPAVQTVTLKGTIRPPSTDGLTNPPANPSFVNSPLVVTNLAGTLGNTSTKISDPTGNFQVDLRTDTLAVSGEHVKVAWTSATRGGILLERTYLLSKNQSGTLEGDLTDLSTLTTLAIEDERQLDPSRLKDTPSALEQNLAVLSAPSRTLLTTFQQHYYAYLANGPTPPGADANLAQDAVDLLFH